MTVKHCLLHNSGLAPDPSPWYWNVDFNCPNTLHEFPEEDFSCVSSHIYQSMMSEVVTQPPGELYVYSDLGFIVLSFIVGTVAKQHNLIDKSMYKGVCASSVYRDEESVDTLCAFQEYVRSHVFQREVVRNGETQPWLPTIQYVPDESLWDQCAPTINDTGEGSYTHKRPQGQVSDGNCYAMGGICGHAGIFSNVGDVGAYIQYMVGVTGGYITPDSNYLNQSVSKYFTEVYNETQSSRGLGWTTNSNLVMLNDSVICTTILMRVCMHACVVGEGLWLR